MTRCVWCAEKMGKDVDRYNFIDKRNQVCSLCENVVCNLCYQETIDEGMENYVIAPCSKCGIITCGECTSENCARC